MYVGRVFFTFVVLNSYVPDRWVGNQQPLHDLLYISGYLSTYYCNGKYSLANLKIKIVISEI